MNNIKTKSFIFILVGLSALLWLGLSIAAKIDLSNIMDFLKLVPTVVTIDTAIVFVFTKWLWGIPLFRPWLVPFPNLNGTWLGSIHSDWVNPETNEQVSPIPVMLTIKQSFFGLSCVMQTTEMKSFSQIEGFAINEDRQVRQLSYIYSSKPRIAVGHRSGQHDGSIVFDIVEAPERRLIGRYWTERKTTGEILLTFKTTERLEVLPNCTALVIT